MWVEGTATKEELDFLYNIDKDDKLKSMPTLLYPFRENE